MAVGDGRAWLLLSVVAFVAATQWVLARWLGLRPEQLAWFFGEHTEEEGEGVGDVSRNRAAEPATRVSP